MPVLQNRLKSDFRFLLLIVGILTLVGIIFIYSSSSVYALEKMGSSVYFLKKHLVMLLLAIFGFVLFATVPTKFWRKYSPLFFLMALIAMILTFLPYTGMKMHGSSRWLNIFGFSLQPSEFLKLFLLMYMGFFFERKINKVQSFVHSYLPFLTILGVTFILLLKQPDFGAVVTIFATALTLFFVASFNWVHLLITIVATLPVGIFLIFSQAYRLNRILIFLNPWSDPQGRGFQIIQSLIAIGSGQIWGVGISNSKQKFFYLPMQHTDFIFPIVAEETGFVGSCLLVSLYFLFCYFGLKIALKLESPFAFFTTLGFVVLISLQAVINLMVTSGLLPTKGLGLPFVSYGGTSLICLFCMIGLIANFVREQGY
jgi:cell division protein FtsW